VRCLVVDCADGREAGTSVADYASGEEGVLLDPKDPNLARQNPRDWLNGMTSAVRGAVAQAKADDPGFDVSRVTGIGVDTTGSTPLPVDREGTPLALQERFSDNPNAHAWLWKDHTAWSEASEITEKAESQGRPYLAKCGGAYSSEWFWSKVLRCARADPKVFDAAYSWVECQDFVPAWLTGNLDPLAMKRGVCAAGHKAMYHPAWGGLPQKEFLDSLDPRLGELRGRLYDEAVPADRQAGRLSSERAGELGLPEGIPVAVGAFDAHLGAVGSGVRPGVLVKIMGTSTCDVLVGDESTPDIPGVCGIVPGSVIPGMLGIEAGQSAVGDLFNWGTKLLGRSHEELSREAEKLRPGESGLLALDWNNGNRTILVDPLLSGLIVGQTLHTSPPEAYRALIEATAFGARKIVERIGEYRVPVSEIVVCGGIAEKSPLTMQIYADVLNRPMKLSRSSQTCALGAAIFGAVVGGTHPDALSAIGAMTGVKELVYTPCPDAAQTYDRLYGLYADLHDSFGRVERRPDLRGLMTELIAIRREASRAGAPTA